MISRANKRLQDPGRVDLMLRFERELWAQGIRNIAGIDEAGRGPLAGPVVAAAVVVAPGFFLNAVDDSKRLNPILRRDLYGRIMEGAVSVGVGIVDHDVIDEINILNATFVAMRKAVDALTMIPEFLLIDGNRFIGGEIPFATIIDGDSLSFSIAAASIIAKVSRDRIMLDYDSQYPEYGFARHKGYGTREHRSAILRYGMCSIHRKSFSPNLIGVCSS